MSSPSPTVQAVSIDIDLQLELLRSTSDDSVYLSSNPRSTSTGHKQRKFAKKIIEDFAFLPNGKWRSLIFGRMAAAYADNKVKIDGMIERKLAAGQAQEIGMIKSISAEFITNMSKNLGLWLDHNRNYRAKMTSPISLNAITKLAGILPGSLPSPAIAHIVSTQVAHNDWFDTEIRGRTSMMSTWIQYRHAYGDARDETSLGAAYDDFTSAYHQDSTKHMAAWTLTKSISDMLLDTLDPEILNTAMTRAEEAISASEDEERAPDENEILTNVIEVLTGIERGMPGVYQDHAETDRVFRKALDELTNDQFEKLRGVLHSQRKEASDLKTLRASVLIFIYEQHTADLQGSVRRRPASPNTGKGARRGPRGGRGKVRGKGKIASNQAEGDQQEESQPPSSSRISKLKLPEIIIRQWEEDGDWDDEYTTVSYKSEKVKTPALKDPGSSASARGKRSLSVGDSAETLRPVVSITTDARHIQAVGPGSGSFWKRSNDIGDTDKLNPWGRDSLHSRAMAKRHTEASSSTSGSRQPSQSGTSKVATGLSLAVAANVIKGISASKPGSRRGIPDREPAPTDNESNQAMQSLASMSLTSASENTDGVSSTETTVEASDASSEISDHLSMIHQLPHKIERTEEEFKAVLSQHSRKIRHRIDMRNLLVQERMRTLLVDIEKLSASIEEGPTLPDLFKDLEECTPASQASRVKRIGTSHEWHGEDQIVGFGLDDDHDPEGVRYLAGFESARRE